MMAKRLRKASIKGEKYCRFGQNPLGVGVVAGAFPELQEPS